MGGAKTNEPAFNKVKLWFYVIAWGFVYPCHSGTFCFENYKVPL